MINLLGYNEFLNESRIAISWAKPSTTTTKILSFIDEKEKVTKKELVEFLSSIPEDASGKKSDISWARKNKRYVKYKIQEEEANHYCLTTLGKRVLKSFKMNETYSL
jgi:hypothetical protein